MLSSFDIEKNSKIMKNLYIRCLKTEMIATIADLSKLYTNQFRITFYNILIILVKFKIILINNLIITFTK